MYATDFEFDGELASDYGLMICNLSSTSGDVISSGSELTLNTVSLRHGAINYIASTNYDLVLETTFQVIKFDCHASNQIEPLTIDEKREISRWLNRKQYCKTKFICDDTDYYDYVYFEGTFVSLSELYLIGKHVGYELHFVTNRPYALGDTIKRTFDYQKSDDFFDFYDHSDEVGFIYPKVTLKFPSAVGVFRLTNYAENGVIGTQKGAVGRVTEIKNISAGEEIWFDENLNFGTNIATHEIQKDFNYQFFRISNKIDDRLNKIVASAPCTLTFEYIPIVKGVGI